MKMQVKYRLLSCGAVALVLLDSLGIGWGIQRMMAEARRKEAENILYHASERIQQQLRSSLNQAEGLAQTAQLMGQQDPQWLDEAAAALMQKEEVQFIYLFEGDQLVRALPQAEQRDQEGRRLNDFTYVYTLAKVIKDLVVEGPLVLSQQTRPVFLFVHPILHENQYRGLVAVALDSDDVLRQFDLEALRDQGYAYELWRVDQQTGHKEIVLTSNQQLDFSRAAKTTFYLPTEWNMSIQPVQGWISSAQKTIVAGMTVISALFQLLMGLVLFQGWSKRRASEDMELRDRQTGLYSRLGFERQFDRWLNRYSTPIQLFYLVFEGYDQAAQQIGPQAEAQFLSSFAARIEGYVKSPYLAARIGSGTLAVAVRESMDSQQREDFARGLSLELLMKIRLHGEKSFLTARYQHALATAQPANEQLSSLILAYYGKRRQESPVRDLTDKLQRLIKGQPDVAFDEYTNLDMMELSKGLSQYRKQAEQMAYSDPMLKVGNRLKYQRDLDLLIQYDKKRRLTLYCIDICSFSQFNELFSADLADRILRIVVQRLSRVFGTYLYRMNGDVFLGIALTPEEPQQRAEQLHVDLSKPIATGNATLSLQVRIAVCRYPDHGNSSELLLDRIQAALRFAKEHDQTTIIYNAQLDQRLRTEAAILRQLKTSIENQTLEVWYQPLMNLPMKRFTAAEALVRLPNPEGGYYAAGQVVALAERSALAEMLGDYVLKEACQCMKQRGQTLGLQRMSVNLSVQQLLIDNSAEHLLNVIQESGVSYDKITLEITESILIQSLDQASVTLNQLRKAGIRIALDDFGVGYSSLNYLSNLPVDIIKIDRSLTKQILTSEKQYTLLKAIVEMADVNQLSVVAEGIETAAEQKIIENLGIQYIQGYYYAKPVPEKTLSDFLAQAKKTK